MWKRLALTISIFIISSYVLFMGVYFPTSEPTFCRSCHYLEGYYDSWQESPHNEVKCLFCHEPRGFLGKLHSKARGLNYVYQHYTDNYSVITGAIIPESNCIACHLGDNKQFPDAIKLSNQNINHYQLITSDQSCLKCHKNTGHDNYLYLNPNFEKEE